MSVDWFYPNEHCLGISKKAALSLLHLRLTWARLPLVQSCMYMLLLSPSLVIRKSLAIRIWTCGARIIDTALVCFKKMSTRLRSRIRVPCQSHTTRKCGTLQRRLHSPVIVTASNLLLSEQKIWNRPGQIVADYLQWVCETVSKAVEGISPIELANTPFCLNKAKATPKISLARYVLSPPRLTTLINI